MSERNIRAIFYLILFVVCFIVFSYQKFPEKPQLLSNNHTLYHGVYPGGFSGAEDDFSELDLVSYESHVNKKVAFVYFSDNWYKNSIFPEEKVNWIYKRNSIPFIRLMLRSAQINQQFNEKPYSLERIASGAIDTELIDWFLSAKNYAPKPMFVEYGVEVNGEWFSWNAKYNGEEKGPELFKRVYKRIINIARECGAYNVLFSFHVDSNEYPKTEWNRLENYYPGNDYIDLMTVSVYGMLTFKDVQVRIFSQEFNKIYNRLQLLDNTKKIMVIEFGSDKNNKIQKQTDYAIDAFESMLSDRWPNLIGFSWWNEFWPNGVNEPDSVMRVQENKELQKVFQHYLSYDKIKDTLQFKIDDE